MGSGKSTVGTRLARQLGWRFVDLDERIEESAGITIPQFFERYGEPAFRQMEADQLRAALGRAVESTNPRFLLLAAAHTRNPAPRNFSATAGVPVIWLDTPSKFFSPAA